jgi:hypothetical protein
MQKSHQSKLINSMMISPFADQAIAWIRKTTTIVSTTPSVIVCPKESSGFFILKLPLVSCVKIRGHLKPRPGLPTIGTIGDRRWQLWDGV